MYKTAFDRNSSLGVSSCDLKRENKTYKLKRSINYKKQSLHLKARVTSQNKAHGQVSLKCLFVKC